MIRTRSNGISVKFYITLRKGLVSVLQKLQQKFDLIIYSSLDQDMGNAIIDYLEQKLNNGKQLFV